MPSTTSSSVARLLASSTVITPSLPTFCIASASILPTSASPFEEIVPTWAISSEVVTFFGATLQVLDHRLDREVDAALEVHRVHAGGHRLARPRARSPRPGWWPWWCRRRRRRWSCDATSRTICAPMFSNLSESSISLATVTPSLVIRGAPKLLSSTTLRPFGPSVTLTASARIVDAPEHPGPGVGGELDFLGSHRCCLPGRVAVRRPWSGRRSRRARP